MAITPISYSYSAKQLNRREMGNLAKDDDYRLNNKDAKGETLLIEFIKQNVNQGNKTDLLCFEKNPLLLKNLPAATNFNCHFVSSNLSWFNNVVDSGEHTTGDPFKLIQKIQHRNKSCPKAVLIIDSLSSIALSHPEKCYREIYNVLKFHNSGSPRCQLICLLHSDVIQSGKKLNLIFERLATTNVFVGYENKQSQVTIRHRKASGRIIEEVEQFYFDQSLNLVTKEIVKVKENNPEDDNKDWMKKEVTFKLELQEEEKRARSKLVLPYLKTNEKESTGEIYYEPDATDDWDEEDPDDDLNI